MPRIAGARPPAEPSSPHQKDRYARILRVARRLGSEHDLERVQMQDVANGAGVAIATLYRYFPSKTHLFSAVKQQQIERLAEEASRLRSTSEPPLDAVVQILVRAREQMMRNPRLARAVLQADHIAQATSRDLWAPDRQFGEMLLAVAGFDSPTPEQRRLVRLVESCWYGVLLTCLNERTSAAEADIDIRVSCEMLLGPHLR
ncbi:TetR/AcrR family transcriptional regulator [Actinomadura darangshiensis]|uniref:TetR/AcrR family transcriptional regulator n=1 Tax=Actinomadura darangshiensis TaxID=705336 RepID=A0A4R5BQ44_9ACTN|nr:TetR family transcriptional regulator [Actinomadura darangshiensis]TDD87513.1 TetR/AcrR family transcriptional regulator [Actinomadura darangshiensis]